MRDYGTDMPLAGWVAASIRLLDQTLDVAKCEHAGPAVRGPLEDAVISLHEARRANEQ